MNKKQYEIIYDADVSRNGKRVSVHCLRLSD